jgi:hypothetical protein
VTLLAAVGHPDREYRRQLARWLDAVIAERGPCHHEHQVRSFLRQPLATSLGPLVLEPSAREIAVRLIRLVFSRDTPDFARYWLRLVRTDLRDDTGGVMITRRLQTMQMESFLRCERRKSLRTTCSFAVDRIGPRLRQLQEPDKSVRVTCRAGNGFSLLLSGKFPWDNEDDLCAHSILGAGQRLDHLGFQGEGQGNVYHLRTTTPEAVIAFSAALLRGDQLLLRGPNLAGRVTVTLHDFEGEETELPAVVRHAGPETWLARAPSVSEYLGEEDAAEIGRWLSPPESWLKTSNGRKFWEKVLR